MSLRLPVYLDHNATTPVDPRVFEAIAPYFCEHFGNAASRGHSFGWTANQAVDKARRQVAQLIGAQPDSIIFTSGATESDNLAIKGVAEGLRAKGRHIITQTTEHKAVIDPCKRLETDGFEVTWLAVDRFGRVDPDDLRRAIRPDTVLVSIMYANNEIGTIQAMRDIGAVCRERNVLLHSDATQAVGKIPVDVETDRIDLLSLTGHKIYGPKGCGALFVGSAQACGSLRPLIDGGGQERGYRSGTLNVPGIVGLGMACEIAHKSLRDDATRLRELRDRLEQAILQHLGNVRVNGCPDQRLPQTSSLTFADLNGMTEAMTIEDVAVSAGSACQSANPEPSHVLRAIGVDPQLARNTVRFSLGRSTTREEVDFAIERTVQCVTGLRDLAAMCAAKPD
ncbi:MAG: cysteine desulfurase family protein [Tepidisphaeraceae bacterium]